MRGKGRVFALLAAAGVLYALVFVVVLIALASGSDLGNGSVGNTVIEICYFVMLVVATWGIVDWVRLNTPRGGITGWRHVGKATLFLWGGLIAYGILIALLSGPFRIFGILSGAAIAFVPAMLWLPIWTVIAASRGRRTSSTSYVEAVPTGEPVVGSPHASVAVAKPFAAEPQTRIEEPAVGLTPVEVEAGAVEQSIAAETQSQFVASAVVQPGEPKSSRNLGRWAAIGIAIIIAIGGLWVLDAWQQSRELNQIVDAGMPARDAWEQTLDGSSTSIQTLQDSDKNDSDYAIFFNSFHDEMRKSAVANTLAIRDLEGVSVLPWHSTVIQFKNDYIGFLEAKTEIADLYTSLNTTEQLSASSDKIDLIFDPALALVEESRAKFDGLLFNTQDAVNSLFAYE
jgi:hypothetical protein